MVVEVMFIQNSQLKKLSTTYSVINVLMCSVTPTTSISLIEEMNIYMTSPVANASHQGSATLSLQYLNRVIVVTLS